MTITAKYQCGTFRVVPPHETLDRVTPVLPVCGITRCTSVTHLDTIGIPVYCSIRPRGLVLQVSNGKGLTDDAAKASAIMEALEIHHAENPVPERLQRANVEELRKQGINHMQPCELEGFRGGYFSDRFICDWVEGRDLVSGKKLLVPASAVYFYCTPSLYVSTTNGLASGNHPVEAILHALYELIERDAVSRLSVNGKLQIRKRCSIIDTSTVDAPELREILDMIHAAGVKVVLLWVESCVVPVPTFWALFLDRNSPAAGSTLNVGWGTHLDIRVAAARAITEAAQSRLTFIHGARDDAMGKPVYYESNVQSSPTFRYFDNLQPTLTWAGLSKRKTLPVTTDLEENLEILVTELARAGHDCLIKFDLTRPDVQMPVARVLAPSLIFNRKLF